MKTIRSKGKKKHIGMNYAILKMMISEVEKTSGLLKTEHMTYKHRKEKRMKV